MTTAQHQSKRTPALQNIQALRLLATYRVVVFHAGCVIGTQRDPELVNAVLAWSPVRLDTFFVMSGFIVMVALGRRPTSAREFLRRRVMRLMPLYWLATALASSLSLLTHSSFRYIFVDTGEPLTWQRLVCSSLLLPCGREPLVYPAWTLTLEWLLYLSVGVALATTKTNGTRVVVTTTVVALMVALGSSDMDLAPGVIEMLTHTHLMEAALGAVLGACFVHFEARWRGYLSERPAPAYVLAALALGSPVIVTWLEPPDDSATFAGSELLFCGVPAALVVLAVALLECADRSVRAPWLSVQADATYSVYLIHPFILDAVMSLAQYLHIDGPDAFVVPSYVLTATCASIAAGHVIHRRVERPIAQALSKYVSRRAVEPDPPRVLEHTG